MKTCQRLLFLATVLLFPWNSPAQQSVPKTATIKTNDMSTTAAAIRYDYETVPGDPLGVKIYTLKNGMKLYMSVNTTEPRIQTNIAVRAGSKHDPAETTGLAHYLEHMLFKGTDRIGALNWEEEQKLLAQISNLYEQHRAETDPGKRTAIYAEIDRVSNEAAKLVAANEYDKMVSSLGARGTNAYTWVEQTVYVNDIPSNELARWMELEAERFRMCVLRLFHTELEAVYEEFNINQDRDFRKVSAAINETLYPSHPYGTQTTIGTGEHLKNPSHVKIQEYFGKYYVPNNMAIVLAGDFNPDEVVALAEKHFGNYPSKQVPKFTFQPQPELQEVVRKDVFGQEAEYVQIAWRFDGANSADPNMLSLIRGLLYNRQAGLIDLNLLQKQKLLEARASAGTYEDFSTFTLYGKPREGQTLEDVEKLLLAELENVKNGKFEDWLTEAVIKDYKLGEIRSNESNGARASFMTDAFILGLPWKKYVQRFDEMSAYSKDEVVAFAKKRFQDNYVVVYKRNGDDPNVYKVEKPAITPVTLNREVSSTFAANFLSQNAPALEPAFLDYEELIQSKPLEGGVQLDYIHNADNPTFSMNYIVEMGKNHDQLLPIAVSYLPYLGTDRYTAEQLQQEFFRLGLSFDVYSGDERVYVTLSGLDESFEEGVKLFEHILANVTPSEEALSNVIDDIMVKRTNATKDKRTILRSAMSNYARYGEDNPFTDILPENELRQLKPEQLTAIIKQLTGFEHKIFYYGSQKLPDVAATLEKHHQVPAKLQPVAEEKEYPELAQQKNKVYYVDFPMVQAEILLISKGSPEFNLQEYIMAELYNNYFGFGLSSIVFQEIRESKALAYSAYAYYSSPSQEDRSHYLQAYVGTQVDKMPDAVPAMLEIVQNMPVSEEQIDNARQSILKRIETERITKSGIYWNYRSMLERGYDHDLRKDIYEAMQRVTPADLLKFQEENVKGRNFTFLVLGSKESLDFEYLKTLGEVEELQLKDIFGYELKP